MKKRAVMIVDYDIPNGSIHDAVEKYKLPLQSKVSVITLADVFSFKITSALPILSIVAIKWSLDVFLTIIYIFESPLLYVNPYNWSTEP